MCAAEFGSRTVLGFPQNDSSPGESGTVELDLPQASFPPGEGGAEDWDYIRPAWLAGSSVCARTVTGSLLFGSPHRFVRSCLRSAVFSLRWIDDLDIFRRSTDIPQNHNLVTVISRLTPDICLSAWTVLISPSWCGEIRDSAHWKRLGQYLIPLDFVRIVLILCYFCRVFATRFMASGRSPDMDQAGPSYAPSDPLLGTFLGLALDIRSEKLHDLAVDIPDVMGLRALRPGSQASGLAAGLVYFHVKISAGSGTLAERSAKNVSVVRNLGTVRIVESISSGIWASTLPSTTWNSHSCGAVRLCGARCGRGLLRTVLITCGRLIMSRCR